RGHGATLDLVVPGKSLLDSRCSDKQERSTLPWFDRARSWRGGFFPSLFAIAQKLFFSFPFFFFFCSPISMATRRSDLTKIHKHFPQKGPTLFLFYFHP